jgi:two-component system chemotaxis sensor kinase CheA
MPEHDSHADFVTAFMDDYFAECEEHLHAVRTGLLALESSAGSPEPPVAVVEDLFRSFHSLKGISAMVELREAEQLAHEMESCLRAIRAHEASLSAPMLDALVEGVHALDRVIAARRSGSEMPPVSAPLGRLASVSGVAGTALAPDAAAAPPSAPAPPPLWRVTFTPSPALVARGIKVDTIRARLAERGRIHSVSPRVEGGSVSFEFIVAADGAGFSSWTEDGVVAEMIEAAEPDQASSDVSGIAAPLRPANAPFASGNVVRVDLARLDELMRKVGDLVISRARLEDTLERVEQFLPVTEWRTLQEHSESIERHLRDLREGVMRARLVPVGEIFRRMPFVVRDLARDSGKKVHLDLHGQHTEIDKFLIERMLDPLVHLVRNAVSHGVEPPAERTAAGKRPEATIRLAASTLGESVMLDVSDDGRGLDAAAIVARARERGIEVPDGPLDARLLLDIICAPGFSTRDAVDRVSGRGVGMSVVRDTIQELGGTMTLETARGEGTTFRITLPLTLAIADALIVHAGAQVFAVPQSAVREVGEVESAAIRVIENNELVTHRGLALPVVRLARLFRVETSPRARMHLIVIGTDRSTVGILVDRIAGQREIVVKTITDPLIKVAGVMGATELGDGRLVLILEPTALTRAVRPAAPVRAAV